MIGGPISADRTLALGRIGRSVPHCGASPKAGRLRWCPVPDSSSPVLAGGCPPKPAAYAPPDAIVSLSYTTQQPSVAERETGAEDP